MRGKINMVRYILKTEATIGDIKAWAFAEACQSGSND